MKVDDLIHTPILNYIARGYDVEYIFYVYYIKQDEDRRILHGLMDYNLGTKIDRLEYTTSNTLDTITLTITI